MLNRQTVANKDYILTCTVMGDIHKQWFQLGVFLFCMVHSLTTDQQREQSLQTSKRSTDFLPYQHGHLRRSKPISWGVSTCLCLLHHVMEGEWAEELWHICKPREDLGEVKQSP